MKPKVSLAILNWNGMRYLKTCLDSCFNQTYENVEIILTDNGSTDGSVKFIKENYPKVKIIENKVNLGGCKGYNVGIRNSTGEYVAVMNNDIILDEDWVKKMVEFMEKDKEIAMCVGKIRYIEDPKVINVAGVDIRKDGSAYILGEDEEDKGQYGLSKEVFSTCNAASIYRKTMFDQIGLFDEDFGLYYEEIDLSWRIFRNGWKCFYNPKALIYHERGGTEGKFPINRLYMGERNRIWTNIKNMPFNWLVASFIHAPRRIWNQKDVKRGYIKGSISKKKICIILLKAWIVGIFGSGKMIKKRFGFKGKIQKNYVGQFMH